MGAQVNVLTYHVLPEPYAYAVFGQCQAQLGKQTQRVTHLALMVSKLMLIL